MTFVCIYIYICISQMYHTRNTELCLALTRDRCSRNDNSRQIDETTDCDMHCHCCVPYHENDKESGHRAAILAKFSRVFGWVSPAIARSYTYIHTYVWVYLSFVGVAPQKRRGKTVSHRSPAASRGRQAACRSRPPSLLRTKKTNKHNKRITAAAHGR